MALRESELAKKQTEASVRASDEPNEVVSRHC
jgi:hypothetical protein